MRTFLVLLGIMFSMSSMAEDKLIPAGYEKRQIKFFYNSQRDAYACSYLESRTKEILTSLGAEEIKIKCSGGLPMDWQIRAKIEFYSLTPMSLKNAQLLAVKDIKQIAFRESCDFNEQLTRRLLKGFKVYKTKTRGSCWFSQGNMVFDITTLHEPE